MNIIDWRLRRPVLLDSSRAWLAVAAVVGLGLAASGCAQSMSEFARNDSSARTVATAYPAPGDPQVAGVARPAVMVEETTVPAPTSRTTRTMAPMAIAPATAEPASAEQPGQGIAPAAVNLNRVPEQPKSKLLTPDEKAQVIAELEALAKKQSATLGKSKKSTTCAGENLDPAARVASATGDGGC
jgi:hypothetical protein